MRQRARQTSWIFVLVGAFAAVSAHATKLQFGLRAGGTISGDTASAPSASNLGYAAGIGFRTIGNGFLQANVDALLVHRRYGSGADAEALTNLYAPAQLVFNLNTLFLSGGAYYATGLMGLGNSTDYGWLGGVGFRTERFSLEARYSRGLKSIADEGTAALYHQFVDILVGFWLF